MQDSEPLRAQVAIPSFIATPPRRLRVKAAIEFNDQPEFEATKIHDEFIDRLLPANLIPLLLTIPENFPGDALSLGFSLP